MATDNVVDITEKPKDDTIPESDYATHKLVEITEKPKMMKYLKVTWQLIKLWNLQKNQKMT